MTFVRSRRESMTQWRTEGAKKGREADLSRLCLDLVIVLPPRHGGSRGDLES